MRQTLCYIPETCYGIPVFGWGWGLGMLLAAIIITHIYQYVRHRKISDLGGSFVLLGVGGALFVFVVPHLAEPGLGIPIRGYGACLLVAILAALTLIIHLAKRQGMETEQVYSLCFWSVVCGIIGARLFYVTEYWQSMILFDASGHILLYESLSNVLNFTQGGLTVFGSVLGGILGAVIFMLRNKMPVLRSFDILAAALPLGMAIGRIGCLLNGCCFGGVTDVSWGIVFPAGSPAHMHQFAHGDVFFYGLKFKEIDVPKPLLGAVPHHWQTMLAVAEVQPDSEAESLGVKPDMLLRYVSSKKNDEPEVWEPYTRQMAAEILIHLRRTQSGEAVQFDFLSGATQPTIKPYPLVSRSSEVLPVHPTQIYSSILALLLCGVLLLLGRLRFYRQRSGLVFASFMILYSVGRFMIEFVRTDEDSFFGTGLTVSQNVSIVFCLAGVALFVYVCRK
jgi:phosphatidylglycerol:prolipoprotein diacylglycerol transferase